MPPSFTTSLVLKGRDQASAAVKGVTSSFGKLGSFLASKFVFTLGDVTRLFGAVSDAINRSTEEAIKAEQATRRLDVALALAGDTTQKTKDASEAWTKALQSQTTTSQEAIKEAAALALSFGVATEDLEKFTRTALDFAPVADIGFTEAVRRMGRALSGSVEDLAKFSPEILELTKQQLRAGEATDLLAEAVKGTAAALADTYEGAVDGVTTAWREFNKAVGATIIDDPALREALNNQAAAIDRLTEASSESGGIIAQLSLRWNQAKTISLDLTTALIRQTKAMFEGSIGWRTLDKATQEATESTEANTKAAKLNAAQLTAQRQATELLKEELRALGIILDEDLNEAIARDTELIDNARKAYDADTISLKTLILAEEGFGARIEENQAKLRGHTEATDDGTRAFKEFSDVAFETTENIDGYSVSLERARGELIDLQRIQLGGVPSPASIQVGGIGSRARDGGLFPGLSGTSFSFTFETGEEADDFIRRVNRQSAAP